MSEYNDAYPDPENVCKCGGHKEADRFKCKYCRGDAERDV